MKHVLFYMLVLALAVSLWFNLRSRPVVKDESIPERITGTNPAPQPAQEAVLPAKVEEMDFSGTALADEAWNLPAEKLPKPIPDALPVPGLPAELPPLPPTPADWERNTIIPLKAGP